MAGVDVAGKLQFLQAAPEARASARGDRAPGTGLPGGLAGPRGAGRSQGRSMVISRGGIVAAESPLAAQAGATILAHGGNAIDAIVATNAVMGVVEPMMNGMGGDLFAIVYIAKTGKLYGLNASGWSPAEAHDRVSEGQGHHADARVRHRHRYGAGRGRRLVEAAVALWNAEALRCAGARDRLRATAFRCRNGMRILESIPLPPCTPTQIFPRPT